MVILKIACDNMYMFKDFSIDFTYKRQVKHSLSASDALFDGSKIKVRKNIVIMGGNATGKTTFGKLMCIIANYIYRGQVNGEFFNLLDIPFDKGKKSKFSVEFYCKGKVYFLEVEFMGYDLVYEKLRCCDVYKTYNIDTLRKKLALGREISSYECDANTQSISDTVLISQFFFHTSDEALEIKNGFAFRFQMTEVNIHSFKEFSTPNEIGLLNEFLPKIDNSVTGVGALLDESGKPTDSYQIKFRNGSYLVVPDGDLSKCGNRLSYGTHEAIVFFNVLLEIQKIREGCFYIDEKLAHIHSELEGYLIRKAFIVKPSASQVFFTTHNIDIFQINIPANAFIFFKRNEHGFNEAIFPSEIMNKNDRNLSTYYENDYFGVLPDYSLLDSLFEEA